jgi:GNAT superfamily N-acetyltransferase
VNDVSESQLFEAIDATWPPFEMVKSNGWLLRQGLGGGQRVSAATQVDPNADPNTAARRMLDWGQTPLFMIRESDLDLDTALAVQGYKVVDPVVLLGQRLSKSFTQSTKFRAHEAPTIEQLEIWENGGVGPARIDVMQRAKGPKCFAAFQNGSDTVATAFVAIHEGIAMVHAVEVPLAHRRRGYGLRIMKDIQSWAAANGAESLVVLTVRANVAARSLYENMGMTEMGAYHYRKDQNIG